MRIPGGLIRLTGIASSAPWKATVSETRASFQGVGPSYTFPGPPSARAHERAHLCVRAQRNSASE
eukprot:6724765-Karenia_brevis.AAC.1